MGLALTIVYIVLTIISPTQFGPAWANYHALVYLAIITALFSLPSVLSRSSLLYTVQTYLLLAFIFVVGFSQIANHWLGGALDAWLRFLPSVAVFFFIVANVTTVRRLKILIFAWFAACLGLVAEALLGWYHGFLGGTFVLKMMLGAENQQQLLRLRAVGFLNDPNDFSQMLIIIIALLFIAWRQGRILSNTAFVLAPAAVLLWAIYLTHSRGALLGLAVLGLMAGYKRLGKVPALVLSGTLGLGLMALDFTGGRAIDPSAGADRLELWAEGLEMFKHSPIFGVGFGNFTDLAPNTAHNSFILPLAELGIIGATIFVAVLVTTTLDLNRLIALREHPLAAVDSSTQVPAASDPSLAAEPAPALAFDLPEAPFPYETPPDNILASCVEPYSPAELPERLPVGVARFDEEPTVGGLHYKAASSDETFPFAPEWPPPDEPGSSPAPTPQPETASTPEPVAPGNHLPVIRAALVTFMSTGWFLSRTYDATFYLVLGVAVAAIGLEPAAAQPRDQRRWMAYTLGVEAFLIAFIYLVVRLRH